MADGSFVFEMNGYNYDPYDEGHYSPGECYRYHTHTFYIISDKSKGKFKFLNDSTVSLELICSGKKRIVKYGYGFNDSGFLVMAEVFEDPYQCYEGCYDIFKKIK